MARINVEDKFWTDPRFRRLAEKIGYKSAIGECVLLWKLGIRFWSEWDKENKKCKRLPIPLDIFLLEDFSNSIIELGFAKISDCGRFVSICGADDHFSWIESHKNKASKGGANKINNITVAQLSPGLAPAKSPTLTPTLTHINNNTKGDMINSNHIKINHKESVAKAPVLAKAIPTKISESKNEDARKFISEYVKAFQNRFGSTIRPDLGGKVQGQIKALLKSYKLDTACQMIQVYFQMKDPWFEKKAYDFSTFTQNIQKVYLAMQRGTEDLSQSRFSQDDHDDFLRGMKQ